MTVGWETVQHLSGQFRFSSPLFRSLHLEWVYSIHSLEQSQNKSQGRRERKNNNNNNNKPTPDKQATTNKTDENNQTTCAMELGCDWQLMHGGGQPSVTLSQHGLLCGGSGSKCLLGLGCKEVTCKIWGRSLQTQWQLYCGVEEKTLPPVSYPFRR